MEYTFEYVPLKHNMYHFFIILITGLQFVLKYIFSFGFGHSFGQSFCFGKDSISWGSVGSADSQPFWDFHMQ